MTEYKVVEGVRSSALESTLNEYTFNGYELVHITSKEQDVAPGYSDIIYYLVFKTEGAE